MMRADKLVLIAGFPFGAPALPQNVVPIPAPSFPADLWQYLSLTGTQMPRADDRHYNQAGFSTQQCTLQLQIEIVYQSRKDPLDPMAIGVRYAEIESIRR